MKHVMRPALAAAVIGLFTSVAQATPIKLDWTTTIQNTQISGLSAGNKVTMTFEFDLASGSLNNATLNSSNFVGYSFTLFDGRSATFNLTASPGRSSNLGYVTNNYFVFDAAGRLQQVNRFFVNDGFVTSNVAAWNGTAGVLYNNGANCLSCNSSMGFHVDNVQAGLLANSWTVRTNNVPEPATLALVAVGLVGSGLARRRRLAA